MSFTAATRCTRLAHTGLPSRRSRPGRGDLEFEAEVAPGVAVTWDPATPRQCVAFSVDPDPGGGEPASGQPRPPHPSGVTDRAPWLRLAAVTMFDHRLYLPLDRALLDAEIAAAQVGAALTLSPAEPIRDDLVDRALVRGRRAARGVVQYLDRWTAAGRRPPPPLQAALGAVTSCYTALCAHVNDYDAALVAVVEAAERLALVAPAPARTPHRAPAAEPPRSGSAQLDPRLLPARVLRLGPHADSAEIDVAPTHLPGRWGLRVRVPAFDPLAGAVDLPDVAIRLVHRRSGRVDGHGLLGPADQPGERCLEGVVSLPDATPPEDVRVELYDAADPPPVSPDDGTLRRVRRGVLFLAGWRALVADVRLWGATAAPAARLRAVVRTLNPDGDADEPLWAGGPALSHLQQIVELGDRKLAALLGVGGPAPATTVIPGDGGATAILDSVAGPGDLLVAELAAAHGRAVHV